MSCWKQTGYVRKGGIVVELSMSPQQNNFLKSAHGRDSGEILPVFQTSEQARTTAVARFNVFMSFLRCCLFCGWEILFHFHSSRAVTYHQRIQALAIWNVKASLQTSYGMTSLPLPGVEGTKLFAVFMLTIILNTYGLAESNCVCTGGVCSC